jgi:hypothetical protein
MRIRILTKSREGILLDLPEEAARTLIRLGRAVAEPVPQERATVEEARERATLSPTITPKQKEHH